MYPKKRANRLLVDHLDDETIIFDQDRNKAHCLNHSAGLVWAACDGKTSVAELAAAVQAQLGAAFSPGDAEDALAKLQKAHLLEPGVAPCADGVRRGRRAMTRRLAT